MSSIKFTKTEKSLLIDKLQNYFSRELDQELGQFDADFLLDFSPKSLVRFITIGDYTMLKHSCLKSLS